MAQLNTIYNLVVCGLAAVLGTGTKGCKPFLKKVTAFWITPQGFVFDGTQTLDQTYIELLQAQGNLIVLKGIRTFTDNTPEDTTDELEDGTKQIARQGLYEFAAQFINGLYFNAALNSLNSFGQYDVLLVDKEGNILGTKSSTGELKGFTVGMIQAQKFMWATDNQGQREGLMMQLLDRTEFDTDYVFISYQSLDFNPNRIDGVNEVVIAYPSIPSAGTSITVTLKTKQDNKPLTGAAFGDFLFTANGSTSNPTAGDDSVTAGTYVLTVPAFVADDDLTAQIYDNSNNRDVVSLDNVLYKSNTATETAV